MNFNKIATKISHKFFPIKYESKCEREKNSLTKIIENLDF